MLSMQGISKSFPGVQALRGVDLELARGEVVAVLGENGAGKSTLMKILAGAVEPDAGSIHLDGQAVRIASPQVARQLGIAIIFQELQVIPALTARENIFLGRERTTFGWLAARQERAVAREIFAALGANFDPDTPCSQLSIAQQQLVEIARAISQKARLVVMDEPTAALPAPEAAALLQVVRDLRARGTSVLFVSHRLEESLAVADRIVVLRDGACVGHARPTELTRPKLIEWMVGRKIESEFPKRTHAPGEVRLDVRQLRRNPAVLDVRFQLRKGEILGLTGLIGAGRTEVARLLAGVDRADQAEVWLDGKPIALASPRHALRAGICLIPEDRKTQGLILDQSVQENFGLSNLRRFALGGFLRRRRERAALDRHVQQLRIKTSGPRQSARNLSGGNQQKLILAKWLEGDADVFLFDEPTRGVDVGAKHDIYLLMNRLAEQGKAILMISSDLPEVLGMADRILVMASGRLVGQIEHAAGATQEQIMNLIVQGAKR